MRVDPPKSDYAIGTMQHSDSFGAKGAKATKAMLAHQSLLRRLQWHCQRPTLRRLYQLMLRMPPTRVIQPETVVPENRVGNQGVRGAEKNDSANLAGGVSPPPSRAMRAAPGAFAASGPRAMIMAQKADYQSRTEHDADFQIVANAAAGFSVRAASPDLAGRLAIRGRRQRRNPKRRPKLRASSGAARRKRARSSKAKLSSKAVAIGFKNATLTLESIEGQKLQTKDIVFQVQELQPAAKPKTPPVETTN